MDILGHHVGWVGATVIVAFIGSVLSVIASVYAVQISQRTKYVEIITAERVKWLSRMQEKLARFIELGYQQMVNYPPSTVIDETYKKRAEEMDGILYQVRLQFHPKHDADLHTSMMDLIDVLDERKTGQEQMVVLEKLVDLVQWKLKAEWDRIKEEAGG